MIMSFRCTRVCRASSAPDCLQGADRDLSGHLQCHPQRRPHTDAHDRAALLPLPRQVPRRPLRRRHVPEMWLRGRPRRPVRQLRHTAQPHGAQGAQVQGERHDAGAARDAAHLHRPTAAGGAAAGVRRHHERPGAPSSPPLPFPIVGRPSSHTLQQPAHQPAQQPAQALPCTADRAAPLTTKGFDQKRATVGA